MFSSGEMEIDSNISDDGKEIVTIQGIEIPIEEFLQGVLFVLAKNKLTGENDPKKRFVDIVKKLHIHKDRKNKEGTLVVEGEERLSGIAYALSLAFHFQP